MNILLCILQDISHILIPNTAPKNKINNWTKWRIFTWHPGVRFMSSYLGYKYFCFIFLTETLSSKTFTVFFLCQKPPAGDLEYLQMSPSTFKGKLLEFDIFCHWHPFFSGSYSAQLPLPTIFFWSSPRLRTSSLHWKFALLTLSFRSLVAICWASWDPLVPLHAISFSCTQIQH